MHGAGIAGDERVPVGQGPAFVEPAVGAGFGHPGEMFRLVEGEYGAAGHELVAVWIVGAAAGGARSDNRASGAGVNTKQLLRFSAI